MLVGGLDASAEVGVIVELGNLGDPNRRPDARQRRCQQRRAESVTMSLPTRCDPTSIRFRAWNWAAGIQTVCELVAEAHVPTASYGNGH